MKLRPRSLCRLAFLALVAASCGDAPRPVESTPPRAPAQAVWRGFAGRATLKGELATTETGSLMISVYPQGTRMPTWTTKIALDDARLTRNAAGERVLEFELNESNSMIPGDVPEGVALEFEVRFDRDGYVDTKEGDVSAMVPARVGDRELALVLEPGSSRDD